MEGERKNNNKRWYFTREQLENSPSRRFGLDPDKELSYRQQAANLLQDMGQRLNVYPCGLGLRPWSRFCSAPAFRPQALAGKEGGKKVGRSWMSRGESPRWGGPKLFTRGKRGGVNFPLAHPCHPLAGNSYLFPALCFSRSFLGLLHCVLTWFRDFEMRLSSVS